MEVTIGALLMFISWLVGIAMGRVREREACVKTALDVDGNTVDENRIARAIRART